MEQCAFNINMFLEHVGLRILIQIIHAPGACSWSTAHALGALLLDLAHHLGKGFTFLIFS